MSQCSRHGDRSRLDGLLAMRELAIQERLESKKLTKRATVWYHTKVSAWTAVDVPNKEAFF